MTRQSVCGLLIVMAASFLFVGGGDVARSGPISTENYLSGDNYLILAKWCPNNTHVCYCQGGNYCSCACGHVKVKKKNPH